MLDRANFVRIPGKRGSHIIFKNPFTEATISISKFSREDIGPKAIYRGLESLGAIEQQTKDIRSNPGQETKEPSVSEQTRVAKKARRREGRDEPVVQKQVKERRIETRKQAPEPVVKMLPEQSEGGKTHEGSAEKLTYGSYLMGLLKDRRLSAVKFEKLTGISRDYPMKTDREIGMLNTLKIGICMELAWHEFRMLGDLAGSSRLNSMALYGVIRLAKAYGNAQGNLVSQKSD